MQTSKDNLTKKSRKFVKAKLVGMNNTKAAKVAYPNAKTPAVVGRQVMQRPAVQMNIAQALRSNKVTPERIARVVDEGLSAEQRDFEGNSHPDHVIRHKFTDTALKVLGGYAPEKTEVKSITVLAQLVREVNESE